jgi:hypothetical protein
MGRRGGAGYVFLCWIFGFVLGGRGEEVGIWKGGASLLSWKFSSQFVLVAEHILHLSRAL